MIGRARPAGCSSMRSRCATGLRRVSLLTATIGVAGTLGALVLTSWLVLVAAHVDDTYHMSHSAGVLTALAKYADEGTLYPPLYDGHSFGGTRYMPLQIVLHAGGAMATGEYLVSGKLVVATVAVALLVLIFVILREFGCPALLSLGLVGAFMVTSTASWVSIGPRADLLPVLLQLGAVVLIARSTTRTHVVGAGVLCALGIVSKLSAVWAPLAILIWLLVHARRKAILFLTVMVVALTAGIGAFELASDGRMFANVVGLGFSDPDAGSLNALLVDAPRKFVEEMQTRADAVWPLLPIAFFATLLAVARRRVSVYHVAFVTAATVLWLVLTDEGADFYHLIDVEVLTVLVVGHFLAEVLARRSWEATIIACTIAVVVVWNLAASYGLGMGPETREAVNLLLGRVPDTRYRLRPLGDRLDAREQILSEDAYVPVSVGRDPVVLDSFMLARILRTHAGWRRELVNRLNAAEFDKIILLYELDPADYRYRKLHFGADVSTAIARNYRLSEEIDDYWRPLFVYVARK